MTTPSYSGAVYIPCPAVPDDEIVVEYHPKPPHVKTPPDVKATDLNLWVEAPVTSP